MTPNEQKNIFVDKRGTRSKPQKRHNIDFLIVIATTYLKTSGTKIPQNRGRYPLQRRDLPRFCHDNVADISIPRPFRGLISPPTSLCGHPAQAKSQPTCNFIHHHITLHRQIGILLVPCNHISVI